MCVAPLKHAEMTLQDVTSVYPISGSHSFIIHLGHWVYSKTVSKERVTTWRNGTSWVLSRKQHKNRKLTTLLTASLKVFFSLFVKMLMFFLTQVASYLLAIFCVVSQIIQFVMMQHCRMVYAHHKISAGTYYTKYSQLWDYNRFIN